MADSVPAPASVVGLAGIVLAAGGGSRLRPLTDVVPKALCPVANQPLVDLAIDAVHGAVPDVAVNVHHRRALLEPHLAERADVHVSIEEPVALGTAGAVAALRPWLDGRAALIVNADAWCQPDLGAFVSGWDGERVRILVAGDEPFGSRSGIVASILPWSEAARLEPVPSGLWAACWRPLVDAGAVDTVAYGGPFVDCGTPARYLAANLWAAALATGTSVGPDGADAGADAAGGGSVVHPSAELLPGAVVEASVIGPGATVAGVVRRSVIWTGTTVRRREILDHAIRASGRVSVLVR
jgi:NDP-sugar pyrophosphorylase family protein